MLLRVRHIWVVVVCPLLGRKLFKSMSRMRLIICTLKVAISFPWFSKELGLMSSGVHFLLKLIPPVSGLLSRPLLSSWIFNDFIFIISFTPDNDLLFFHTSCCTLLFSMLGSQKHCRTRVNTALLWWLLSLIPRGSFLPI